MDIQAQIKKIQNFKNLKQNWDNYNNADVISDIVINRSILLVKVLSDCNVSFDYVFPGNSNYIRFESNRQYIDIELIVYEDNIILTTFDKQCYVLNEIIYEQRTKGNDNTSHISESTIKSIIEQLMKTL